MAPLHGAGLGSIPCASKVPLTSEDSGFSSFKKELKVNIERLPKHRLDEIRALVTAEFNRRFKKNRIPKYGSINKGFNEPQVQAFFRVIKDPKFHLLFSYQAYLGLRIGEAVRLNMRDINFDTRELVIKTEKSHVLDTLLIPLPLFNETVAYIKSYISGRNSDGYLFYPEKGKSTRDSLFLDQNYVRKKFREYVIRAKLNEAYATSNETVQGRSLRMLHRLTTHSLRHYAITKFSKSVNGNLILTSKFARHSEPKITMTYINTQKEELYSAIENSVDIEEINRIKNSLG